MLWSRMLAAEVLYALRRGAPVEDEQRRAVHRIAAARRRLLEQLADLYRRQP